MEAWRPSSQDSCMKGGHWPQAPQRSAPLETKTGAADWLESCG